MLWAYINYPNPHVTIHRSAGCGNIQAQRKPLQRVITLDSGSLNRELMRFRDKYYKFGATPEFNDMWLMVDLGWSGVEEGVVNDVLGYLAKHYAPFATVAPKVHCEMEHR